MVSSSDHNWAAIDNGKWFTDATWEPCPVSNVYYEYTVTHNDQPTWRIQPDFSSDENSGTDHWGPSIQPGDHIVMSCWIKTGGTTKDAKSYAGARIGFDIYGKLDNKDVRIGGASSEESASDGGISTVGIAENYVPWGSDWVYRVWDFIVPKTYISDGGSVNISSNYKEGLPVQPATIVPWIQIWTWGSDPSTQYPNGAYTSYFSDFKLYINPQSPSLTQGPESIPNAAHHSVTDGNANGNANASANTTITRTNINTFRAFETKPKRQFYKPNAKHNRNP